jgi:hypothetical protein
MSVVLPRDVVPGLLLVTVFLGGCTSLSGVGGDAQYACPHRSVRCGSVTAITCAPCVTSFRVNSPPGAWTRSPSAQARRR